MSESRSASPGTSLFNWEEEWRNGGIFDLMPDAIVAVSSDGTIAKANGQVTAMFGYAAEELIGSPVETLLPESVRARHVRHRVGYQDNPRVRQMSKRQNLLGRRKDGSEFPVDIMLRPVNSVSGHPVIAVIRDVTAAKEAAEQLRRLAYSDLLTGLPNRAALYRDFAGRNTWAPEDREPIMVALFDLDGFKDVNDTLGHSIGDELLQAITRRWTSFVDGTALLYRLGGDEFVVVRPSHGDPLRMVAIVSGMIGELTDPFDISGHAIVIGTSVGLAIGPEAGLDIEELLASADLALYRAKAEGRGSSAMFVPAMRAEAQARRTLVSEIEQGYAAGELELHYQPQVRLQALELSGAEALLRWRRPGSGVLPPSMFIEALSTSPIASEVGRWILRSACQQAKAWSEMDLPGLSVAVNLFQAQIIDEMLPQHVSAVLGEFSLPPDLLELEISENFTLYDDARVIRSLSVLRRQGVGLALDDLGTGHASLSYITKLPVSDVKIDQSFVRKMVSDEKSAVVVHALITMAHGLGLGVVAEGVETTEQARILSASACDRAQGYLFARPLPAAEFEAYASGGAVPASLFMTA